jgi:uncharacterized phage infection (PIP) family protein YhgE
MNNAQSIPIADIIQELRSTITDVKRTQETFSSNSAAYNTSVNTGLQNMQGTIVEINGFIDQITVLITGLKSQISVFEAKQLADPTPRLTAEIEQLRTQLSDAQSTQAEAATAMRESIDALKANNAAMSSSTDAQNVATLNTTISATTASLNDIKTKLENLLQNAPVSTLNPNAAEFVPAANRGGRRRRNKTAKKQRKTRRRKTMKKKRTQKGGYVYNTKRNTDSDSGSGRGRGINTKRKKRRSTR